MRVNESPKENVECARNSEVIILPNMTFWGSLGQQGVAMDVGGNPGNNNVADSKGGMEKIWGVKKSQGK